MEREQQIALLRFFKAVGQEERLKIIGLLAERPCSVPELAALLEMKESALARHLNRLQLYGLIRPEEADGSLQYRLNEQGLENYRQTILENRPVDDLETVVLQRYVIKGKLARLPTEPQERAIALRWLAEHLEPGRRYSASAVEGIIRRYYSRADIMPRHLVENNLLARRGQIYWRPVEE